jgi:hypothetical protein
MATRSGLSSAQAGRRVSGIAVLILQRNPGFVELLDASVDIE